MIIFAFTTNSCATQLTLALPGYYKVHLEPQHSPQQLQSPDVEIIHVKKALAEAIVYYHATSTVKQDSKLRCQAVRVERSSSLGMQFYHVESASNKVVACPF